MDEIFTHPHTRDEAFDFSTSEILPREIDNIRKAVAVRKLLIRQNWHGGKRAYERKIKEADIYHCVTYGKATSKDLPPWNLEQKGARQAGINFDGPRLQGKGRIRVKVGWTPLGYTVVTAHEL